MKSNSNKENLAWINWAKVICLFIVYLYHSESRSGFYISHLDDLVEPFFVNIFFVISGYLIFRKQLSPVVCGKVIKDWIDCYGRTYLSNLLFKIMIPTVLFGALLFVPKILMRGGEFNLNKFWGQSVGGGGLWFTPALAVAEFLLFLLFIVRVVNPYKVLLFSCVLGCLAYFFHCEGLSNYPWYYQTGMCAMVFISIGGVLYDLEQRHKCLKGNKYKGYAFLIAIVFYLAVVLIWTPPLTLNVVDISVQGIFMAIISIVIILYYTRKLPHNQYVDKIGRHTLGLYFLSGAIPESICTIYKHINSFNGFIVFIIAIVSFFIGIIVNELLVRYTPFLFDFRLIKKQIR